MSMSPGPFDRLLLPQEQILWQAKAQPPRERRRLLIALLVLAGFLLFQLPKVWAFIGMVKAVGLGFAVNFTGVPHVVRMLLFFIAAIAVPVVIWREMWPKPARVFGLSDRRAFQTLPIAGGMIVESAFVDQNGPYRHHLLNGNHGFSVPIVAAGAEAERDEEDEDDPVRNWLFAWLDEQDCEAGMTQVNKMIGAATA